MDLVPLLLTYLLPLGMILVAWGAWDTDRVRDNAVTALLIVATVIMSYAIIGFGLQFGGIVRLTTGEMCCFTFIGSQHIDQTQEINRQGSGRSRIEDHFDVVPLCQFDRGAYCFQRNL